MELPVSQVYLVARHVANVEAAGSNPAWDSREKGQFKSDTPDAAAWC